MGQVRSVSTLSAATLVSVRKGRRDLNVPQVSEIGIVPLVGPSAGRLCLFLFRKRSMLPFVTKPLVEQM